MLPPGKPTKRPLSAPVPAPFTSSHQARFRGSLITRMSHRPLNCSSPPKAGATKSSKDTKRVRMDFLLTVSYDAHSPVQLLGGFQAARRFIGALATKLLYTKTPLS